MKHLRNKSPFAHRALVRCLHTVQDTEDDSSLSPVPGFDFIAGPIQRLFKEHPPSLTAILKVLCVLDVRFQQTYVHIPEMDWNKCFDTSVTFLGHAGFDFGHGHGSHVNFYRRGLFLRVESTEHNDGESCVPAVNC